MNVTLLYFEGCPNWEVTDAHLRALSAEHPELSVTHRLVTTPEEAEEVGFRGSPSLLVDGVDPFGPLDAHDAPVGLSCRVYQTPDGPAGSPTLEQLRRAILAGAG
jgi:hypothetical protein